MKVVVIEVDAASITNSTEIFFKISVCFCSPFYHVTFISTDCLFLSCQVAKNPPAVLRLCLLCFFQHSLLRSNKLFHLSSFHTRFLAYNSPCMSTPLYPQSHVSSNNPQVSSNSNMTTTTHIFLTHIDCVNLLYGVCL